MAQDTKIATTGKAADERSPSAKSGPNAGGAPRPAKVRDMGSALRSVYQRTVEEPVPDDLLDLLGKLG